MHFYMFLYLIVPFRQFPATLETHLKMCEIIEDDQNSCVVRELLSTTYGINRKSVLVNVGNFDVCQCFPQDIMHVLFEGVMSYETKLLLRVLLDEKKYLSINDLNQRLDYGYMDSKNKPTLIAR